MASRPARIHYYDQIRLGDHSTARSGDLVILNTNDTPEQCRINGYPVFEILAIQGTSATGPQLMLMPVKAKGRGMWDRTMRDESPSAWRLVRPEDQVVRLD
jgi:hypothetical protein